MDKKIQKEEAIKRMNMLKLHPNAINEFNDEDKLNQSEYGGILYWLDEKQIEIVKEFEITYGAIVYHVIRSYTEFGELLSFLYVSKYKEEWSSDRREIQGNCPMVYVYNVDEPYFSEFGSIGIKSQFGGVIRVA